MKREDTMSYCCVTSYSSDLLIMLASLPVTKSMPGRVKWPAVACISILVVDHTHGAANSLRCCWHQPSHPWRCHMGRPSLCWSRPGAVKSKACCNHWFSLLWISAFGPNISQATRVPSSYGTTHVTGPCSCYHANPYRHLTAQELGYVL